LYNNVVFEVAVMTDYALPSLVELLSPDERLVLESLGNRQTYADGSVIHNRGDPDAAMGVVVKGVVKILRETSDGQQLLMLTVNVGQNYADHNALNKARRTHQAVAAGNTVVDFYPHKQFLQLLEHPGILRALYKVTTLRLGQAVELFDDIRGLTPEVRLAKMLASLRASAGGVSRIGCVQEELASLLGVSAMTLSKALKVLKADRLIDTGYRTVTILDHQRFDSWLEQRAKF
jgi:CRP/FNR family transcriptional regulator, cyclic AMP receptor protein